jgi:hypothetical protein
VQHGALVCRFDRTAVLAGQLPGDALRNDALRFGCGRRGQQVARALTAETVVAAAESLQVGGLVGQVVSW